MVDNSESLTGEHWWQLKTFVTNIINDTNVESDNTNFALIRYTHNVFNEFNLNTYHTKGEIMAHVLSMSRKIGGTNTGHAIANMANVVFTPGNGDRDDAPNLAVVVTDGQSNNQSYTAAQAHVAKRMGIHIIAVGVGLTDTSELHQIASSPKRDNVFNVKDFSHLVTIEGLIEQLFYEECTGTVGVQFLFLFYCKNIRCTVRNSVQSMFLSCFFVFPCLFPC